MNWALIAAAVALLGRDDRPIAGEVVDVQSRPIAGAEVVLIPAVLVALTCLDPRTAVEIVESLPPAKTPSVTDPTNWARITVAELLAMPPERRRMRIWRFYSGCGISMFEDVYRDL
jgi:hypothetical protein